MRDDVRAALVAAVGTAAVAACTGDGPGPGPSPSPSAPSPSPEPDPDEALLRRWLATELALIARYAGSAVPPALRHIRAEHEQHAAALRAELGPIGSVPPGAPVADLAGAEAAAARAYRSGVPALSTRARAVLAAELAASESQHAVLLRQRP